MNGVRWKRKAGCILIMTVLMIVSVFLISSVRTVSAAVTDKTQKKICTVRFYTANGLKEYTGFRRTVEAGTTVVMPSGPANQNYSFYGWAIKAGGNVAKKQGSTVRVQNDLKFYAVMKKDPDNNVKLCRYDGTLWKTLSNDAGKASFPAVNLNSGNMCLGWSRTRGKSTLSNGDYKAGDRIPSRNGKYYMVVFGSSMDKATAVTTATQYGRVYCVGDSRTDDMKLALGNSAPSNVEFIAKGGEGLSWFQNSGYKALIKSVTSRPKKEKKAVIINLGVNDLGKSNAYVRYMKKVSVYLKKYNCDMYYLSVNPVNSAMINSAKLGRRTERQVASFNRNIYQKLCSGKNRYFTYINSCTYLQKTGWISNRHNAGIHDGLHYSNNTYIRIFEYCMKYINR